MIRRVSFAVALLAGGFGLAACGSGGGNAPAPQINLVHAAIQGAKAMAAGAAATLTIKTCKEGEKPSIKHLNLCVEQKVKDGIVKGLPFLQAGIAAAEPFDTGGTADQATVDKVQDIITKAINDYTGAGGQ